MRHHIYNTDFNFVKEPVEFNKNSSKRLLQFCLGATLYTPATRNIKKILIDKNKFPGLTSLVMDCEDGIAESNLSEAEENIINTLEYTLNKLDKGYLEKTELPLLFIRVKNLEHFKHFSKKLSPQYLKILSGFNFPKFDTNNSEKYLAQLENLNNKYNKKLYGMPILESKELAYRELRVKHLAKLSKILKSYQELILNIRVGAADFSSLFGLRRGMDFSIYDLAAVKECLADIINFFNRYKDGFVISGPVWEYFSSNASNDNLNLDKMNINSFYSNLWNQKILINRETDGLLREVILDKMNGFIGKTVIHPSHIKYVNALQSVTEEKFNDAEQIINSKVDGVVKSLSGNKMNEINPHQSWAENIICRAEVYGVIKDESDYLKLMFSRKDQN